MSNLKYPVLVILVVSFTFFSCRNDTSAGDKTDITFTSPPINLDGIPAKFAKGISYGPHPANTFDIFLPSSDTPTPLVLFIHGGGFIGGDKRKPYNDPNEIRTFLNHKVAFATINYRLLKEKDAQGVIKSLSDSKRALQYIRSIADKLNINPHDIALTGTSAGGGTAQWIAFNNDMADPDNPDPVLRKSTRVKALAVLITQATYDLQRWQTDVLADYNFNLMNFISSTAALKQRFESFYGLTKLNQFYSDSIMTYRKKVDMLALMSPDDPPIWAQNTRPVKKPTTYSSVVHHPHQVRAIKERADEVGIPCIAYYGNYSDPSGEDLTHFLLRSLGKVP